TKKYGLDPFTKEIYAFPKTGGGIQPIVSIDGWLNIINNHPMMDGMELQENNDSSGQLESVTCQIHRKDRAYPTTITESLKENKMNTPQWNQRPRRMLRHRAIIQCGRAAFSISGVMDEDEFHQWEGTTAS